MRAQIDTTQRKNESKQSTKNNEKKKSYENRTQGYKTTINNDKKDLRQESCLLPQIGW